MSAESEAKLREKRLSEALRANLHRRKAQKRSRADTYIKESDIKETGQKKTNYKIKDENNG